MKTRLTPLDIACWGGMMAFAFGNMAAPICLPEISRTLSTGLAEGGAMETARTFLLVVVLLLAGFWAHQCGKKRLITLGQYMLAGGLLLGSFADSYAMLVLSLMIVGIGGGFTEALISPVVADMHGTDSGKYLNITHAFYPVGVMLATLLFGELLTLGCSWRTMFRIAAVVALVMGVFFGGSSFPADAKDGHSAWRLVARILVLPGFWLFAVAIFLGAGVESAFTFWSRSYVQAYLEDLPRAGAVAVVCFAGMMAAGRFVAARLSRTLSLKTIMMCSAVLGVVVSAVIPFADTLLSFYALLAVAAIAAACLWPTVLAEAGDCLQVDSTMLLVLLSSMGIAGFGFTPWVMGLIGDRVDLKAGFFVIPVYFVLLVLVLAMERHMSQKESVTQTSDD